MSRNRYESALQQALELGATKDEASTWAEFVEEAKVEPELRDGLTVTQIRILLSIRAAEMSEAPRRYGKAMSPKLVANIWAYCHLQSVLLKRKRP